jgi:hypothetical protein
MKDHTRAANPNLIAIVEGGWEVWDKPCALYDDAIRGLQVFDDKAHATSPDTRVLAADTGIGQTEKTLWMPSEHRGIRQRYLLPTVESLKHVQVCHNFSTSPLALCYLMESFRLLIGRDTRNL